MTQGAFEVCLSEKLERVRRALRDRELDAAVIVRGDNFAWLTTGGINRVATCEAQGTCATIISRESVHMIAKTMDAQRIMDEEFRGDARVQPVALKWYECSPEQRALSMLEGQAFVADVFLGARAPDGDFFQALHYPLTEAEVERYRTLGALAEQAVQAACRSIEPGMTEAHALNVLAGLCAERGLTNAVNLLGADERPVSYKHFVAGERKIARYAVIATAIRKWGLTAPLSRAVYFGDHLPGELADRHRAASAIAAETIALCREGVRFYDISRRQKALFAQYGFADEWELHFQGGLTGYIVNDSSQCLNERALVTRGQVFNWFVTILGAKVEETTLLNNDGMQMVTDTGLFPSAEYQTSVTPVRIPEIMLR